MPRRRSASWTEAAAIALSALFCISAPDHKPGVAVAEIIPDPSCGRSGRGCRGRENLRNRWFADSPLEGTGFEPSVPRRERNESRSGTGTVTEATKVRLEAVAYLPGTDGSNPFPSGGEMLWGRRRDFLPGSQEVKWRDGNPPTNATVPAP